MFRHFFSLIFIGYHIGYHTNHEWIILKFLSLTGINSIRIGLTMYDPSINERYFVLSVTLATHIKDSLKLNNTKNTCLISRNIILYYYLSLNTCECLIFQIYRQNCNRLKNHTYSHLKFKDTQQRLKLSLKLNIFIFGFKFKDMFFSKKQATIITIIMQLRQNFVFTLLKLILKSLVGEKKLPLIPKVRSSPTISDKK